MKLESIRIQNFRTFKDQTIEFDDYTCLVGCNGAGKSTVLTALNVFFRNTASSSTNVTHLAEEDFHHRNTSEPVSITLTFRDLSADATEDLKLYIRHDKLVVRAKAEWNAADRCAEVRQYGLRLVMEELAPYFAAEDRGAKAAELKGIYDELREKFSELPSATSGPTRVAALRAYEESKPELCKLLESSTQFFGFTKGTNLMQKYIQWVYVPAVKDASSEQDEGTKTALGQMLDRTVRSKVNFKKPLDELKAKLEASYKEIIDAEQGVLSSLEASMQAKLQEWASSDARLQLTWNYDSNRSLVVSEPAARARLGEDTFIGEIPRLGHGMQRSFLVALLQELAGADAAGGPTLLLGFEEPELYQHPPQAQHMAALLESLSSTASGNTQVIISTHSPYFISTKGYENVRMVRKHRVDKCSLVSRTTFTKLEAMLAEALGVKADPPSVIMSQIEQIMQPSQKELFFTRFAVLVEGLEDIAFIGTHLKVTGRWNDFRKHGCHFIVAVGKTNLSRPLAIAKELCIGHFLVFDADGGDKDKESGHRRDNLCLLKLVGSDSTDPFPADPVWGENWTVWPDQIFGAVLKEVTRPVWDEAQKQAREKNGLTSVKQKNNMMIAATIEELDRRGIRSAVLEKLCSAILDAAAKNCT